MNNIVNFNSLVKEFLKQDKTYEYPITNFMEYLHSNDLEDRVFNLYENNIDDFFDYALERYIGSQSQITVHIAALKALFGFLIDNKWKFSELNGYISTATFRKKLFEKAEKVFNKPILTKELLNEVLLNIDNYLKFKEKNDKKKKNEEKMYLEILIARLFIKMSLILPIKTGQMLDLCIGDIKNENNRYIIYNDIKIKIPNNLRKDILYTIGHVENRYDNIIYNEQDKIFSFLYQCVDKSANSPTVNNTLLKVYKKLELTEMLQKKSGGKREKYIYPAECYKLTAISNMLETGVNIVYLKKLTGLDIGTLVNGLDFENKIPLKDNVSININSALVMCDYFEYL